MARAAVKTEPRFVMAEDRRSQLDEYELILRMDKHPGHGELSHIHRPGDRPDPFQGAITPDVLSEILKLE
jgi:hypothetical protein